MTFTNVLECGLSVEVLKSNLLSLSEMLGKESDYNRIMELHKEITKYSTWLCNKVSFEEYTEFERKMDEVRG